MIDTCLKLFTEKQQNYSDFRKLFLKNFDILEGWKKCCIDKTV